MMNSGHSSKVGKNNGSTEDRSSGSKKDNDDVVITVVKRSRSLTARDIENLTSEPVDPREDCILTLRSASQKDSMLNRLNTFRRNRELCDVVFFAQEKEIIAHKVVLAAISPALFDLFVRDDQESITTGSSNITPPDVAPVKASSLSLTIVPSAMLSPPAKNRPLAYYECPEADFECFSALVDFAYTSRLEINIKKVGELYRTSCLFQVIQVMKACAQFLAENLIISNCISVRKQASFCNDFLLMDRVDSFIKENFKSVINETSELSQLPCIKIQLIIRPDEPIQMRTGPSLAKRLLAYFQSQPKTSDRPELTIESLAKKTHLLYVEEDGSLEDCAELDDKSSAASCDIIKDYKKTQGRPTSLSDSVPLGSSLTQHHVVGATPVCLNANRTAFSSDESLNSLTSASEGGEEVESKFIAVHDTSEHFWIALCVLHKRLVNLSIQITENDEVTRCISRTSAAQVASKSPTSFASNFQNEAARLSWVANTFDDDRTLLPTMHDARCAVGAAYLNGKIIVCGGYDRGECLKSVEEYDVSKEVWRTLPDMLTERGRFDCAVVGNTLYAVAGSNGNNDLKSVECFNMETKKWRMVKALQRSRSHNGCASLDGLIYCIGGCSDQVVLRDSERYSPVTNEWTPIPPLQTARFQAGCCSWRGLIVACGGCDRWHCLDSVEVYDPKLDQWKNLARMKTPRRGCAVAVVDGSLYVIGGHDGTESLTSVEVLDSPSGQWRSGPSLCVPRGNTRAVVTDDNVIYVVGGFSGTHFLPTIELMATEKLGWRDWNSDVKDLRSGMLADERERDDDVEVQNCFTADCGADVSSENSKVAGLVPVPTL
ncbi:hypothetical protein AB6A40_000868 [Gnathostoma spinigerum]|uniref:BTB domain-containing protein n=1 Tax=Gnathostoma spinigerum TaxID=75299 RepID=A0ABD6E2W8_9BILA